MMRRLIPALALTVLAACGDQQPDVDAELARDLELATAQPAEPQLADVALDASVEPPVPAAGRTARVPSARPATPQRTPTPRAERRRPAPRTPEPAPVVEEPAPTPAPSPAPARARGILAGTSFGLVTRGPVCTSNKPGDKIVAVTADAVTGEDGAFIPAGSSVVLEVVSVTAGDTPESAQISLRVRSVVIGGEAHGVDGNLAITSELERGPAVASGSDKKKVIGGAIAGAVIGQIMGRDTKSTVIGAAAGAAAGTAAATATRKYHACLPAGASARVTTTQPIIL